MRGRGDYPEGSTGQTRLRMVMRMMVAQSLRLVGQPHADCEGTTPHIVGPGSILFRPSEGAGDGCLGVKVLVTNSRVHNGLTSWWEL